jgi:hypothetical protein
MVSSALGVDIMGAFAALLRTGLAGPGASTRPLLEVFDDGDAFAMMILP